jgi:hypothetical protein
VVADDFLSPEPVLGQESVPHPVPEPFVVLAVLVAVTCPEISEKEKKAVRDEPHFQHRVRTCHKYIHRWKVLVSTYGSVLFTVTTSWTTY